MMHFKGFQTAPTLTRKATKKGIREKKNGEVDQL